MLMRLRLEMLRCYYPTLVLALLRLGLLRQRPRTKLPYLLRSVERGHGRW